VSILIGCRSCQIYDHTRQLLHPRGPDHARVHAIGLLAIRERNRGESDPINQQLLQRLPRLDDVASQHFAEAPEMLGEHSVEFVRIERGCPWRPLDRNDL